MKRLKNEVYTLDEIRDMNQLDGDKKVVFLSQLQATVEGLKEEINKGNHTNSHDFISINIIELIDKAFEDVTTKPNNRNKSG